MGTKKDICIFTMCSMNYLAKALALADSVFRIEGRRVKIYIVDKKIELPKQYSFADIEWLEDKAIDDYRTLAFIYDVTEFNTCFKAYLAIMLLMEYTKVVFLDPDTFLFSEMSSIYAALNQYPILLTPHYITPNDSKDDCYDLGMMRFGSFNLGFFAVNDSDEAKKFLDWWSKRCIDFCYFETQFGLSTDQKWVSIAPCFFPNLHVMFDTGLNMAFWNMHERILVEHDGAFLVNGKDPLVFFHFSSFDTSNPLRISKRLSSQKKGGRNDLDGICTLYAKAIAKYDDGYSKIPYAYDYMYNGKYISPTLRRAFACVRYEFPASLDPFEYSGEMMKFINMNHLSERSGGTYKPEGANEKSSHKGKFKMLYYGLRFALRVIGPNSFSNLSRLLVHLSSYRQNREMWKYK